MFYNRFDINLFPLGAYKIANHLKRQYIKIGKYRAKTYCVFLYFLNVIPAIIPSGIKTRKSIVLWNNRRGEINVNGSSIDVIVIPFSNPYIVNRLRTPAFLSPS